MSQLQLSGKIYNSCQNLQFKTVTIYSNFYPSTTQMGSICAYEKAQKVQEAKNRTPGKSYIRTYFHQSQNDRITDLKEFLTLTSQNTSIFFDVQFIQITKPNSSLTKKNISDFKIVRSLGKGSFGLVYMVKDEQKQRFYAMKIIPKTKIQTQDQKVNTMSQRYILEDVNHPFIVKLHYAFQNSKRLYLLVDLLPGGQLFFLLRKLKKFPQDVAKFYAAEILLALQYLHRRNIIYRDLKPQNILLDRDGHIKLTDFGLSKILFTNKQITYSVCGTPEYIAPEILTGKGYNQSADWFSFGSLLYDMLTGKPPFYTKNKSQILKKIMTQPVPVPQSLSSEAQDLLNSLFKIKPKDRLGYNKGAQQIKKHPFFENVNFEELQGRRVKPPISFKEQLNHEGFDKQFIQSIGSNSFVDKSNLSKSYGFDGFTYYRPQLLSPSQKKTNLNSYQEDHDSQNIYYV